MGDILQAKADRLFDRLDEELPDWEIVFKNDADKWPSWWLRVLQWIIGAVGIVAPSVERAFYEDYSQGLYGYILLAGSEEDFDPTDYGTYSTLRHEFVHLMDQKNHPILFAVGYVIPPAFVTLRSYLEMRGYAQNMLVEYEITGEIDDSTLDWIEEQFIGINYFYMDVFKKSVRRRLERLREDIQSGELSGLYPDV